MLKFVMAEIKESKKVLLLIGLIFVKDFELDKVLNELKNDLGNILMKSNTIPFTHTIYYNKEMGDKLMRQWIVFEKLITSDILVKVKHTTNDIEKKYLNDKNGRKINIDPGVLTLSNLILASTKDYSHRIYLGKGIYAEVTLIYKNKTFNPLEWTYPDHQEKIAIEFFEKAREILKQRLAK
ncbi:DUF4416 family protein, partial [candidate division WOR-3 bacterium]|nr:DUF4416 family protein [candidate division WOR-3 bacterium]